MIAWPDYTKNASYYWWWSTIELQRISHIQAAESACELELVFIPKFCGKTCEQMCPMEDVFDVAQAYYDLASNKVDRTLRADKLSTKCLHAMVRFGDVILEDISLAPTSHASQVETDLEGHYTDGLIEWFACMEQVIGLP